MKKTEFAQIFAGVLILFVVISFGFILKGDYLGVMQGFIFSILIICVSVGAKKCAAYLLDAGVEHRIWCVYRYGYKPSWHFKREVPFGIILPLFFSLFSLGFLKVASVLTYETRALKRRAAKRFGYYSYTEMSEWHNSLIGAVGIIAILSLSAIGYFAGFEYLAKVAAYYSFWNLVPVSNLDGTQIFFGNRILWMTLVVISVVFTMFALMI